MARSRSSRRGFLQAAGALAGSYLLPSTAILSQQTTVHPQEALSQNTVHYSVLSPEPKRNRDNGFGPPIINRRLG